VSASVYSGNHVLSAVSAIMLSRIKKDNSQIRMSLLEINDEQLSIDDLKAIGKHLPTPEEVGPFHLHSTIYNKSQVERIRLFGDVSKLAKADQYFHEVRVASLLDCRFRHFC
jgi:hypothetical protein